MTNLQPIVQLSNATLTRGKRPLWSNLNLAIKPGEFIAVLGPNGAGKTSLIKVLLGQLPLTTGSASINGKAPGENNDQIGYIPQQKNFDTSLPIRGRDLVELGLNGSRFGLHRPHKATKQLVDKAIRNVHAMEYANMPIGLLSGGEQQRLRVAQALVGEPQLLLCDEPLLSLDLASQRTITELLDSYRTTSNTAILFVTHEINPILPFVDKVLYIANGRWVVDTPKQVLQSKTLSQLYGAAIEVVTVHGRLLVVGADEAAVASPGAHHHEEHA